MLVEINPYYNGITAVYVPADTEGCAANCRRIPDADWRYLNTFLLLKTDKPVWRPKQTAHYFKGPAARDILAAGEPYLEESDAG